MNLENLLRKTESVSKPSIFDLSNEGDIAKVEQLFKENKIQHVSDDFEETYLELFGIKNPTKVYTPTYKEEFKNYYEGLKKQAPLWQHGRWVYYPWNSTIVHTLEEADFYAVRTARNQNLITKEEQSKFYNARLGIGGLSVGSNVLYALTLQGGPKHIKIADMDRLALTNTNRVVSGIKNLGLLKTEMAARMIYEINPYAEVELFSEGLTKDNVDGFCKDLDVMVDELDSFPIKYLLRERCKKYGIPVLQAADNGDNAVVDIERYDLDKNLPIFQGRLGEVNYEMFTKLDKMGIGRTITQLIGAENITERMQASLLEIGKTIVSWPQLGGAALLNGAAVAYCVRKVLNGQSLEPNRTLINMDELLDPNYRTEPEIAKRESLTTNFKKMFGL